MPYGKLYVYKWGDTFGATTRKGNLNIDFKYNSIKEIEKEWKVWNFDKNTKVGFYEDSTENFETRCAMKVQSLIKDLYKISRLNETDELLNMYEKTLENLIEDLKFYGSNK